MRRQGLVVTGTDTGVGKTVVAAGLVRALRRKGVDAVAWKPVSTGVSPHFLEPGEDADLLLRASDRDFRSLEDVSPLRWNEPLAPNAAWKAMREETGVKIPRVEIDDIVARFPQDAEFVVVEGCGGLLVPVNPEEDMRELFWALGLPLLIVARPALGTINHTRLTVEAAENAGLDVLGVVLCGMDPETDDPVQRSSLEELRHVGALDETVALRRVADPTDPDLLADAVEAAFDLEKLLGTARGLCGDAGADALGRDDRRFVWHPFTQMKEYEAEEPVVIERAKGPWLYDTRGRRYLDGISSLWANVHGHRDTEIDRAVRRQLGKVAHTTLLGLGSEAAVRCARKLIEVAPEGLTRVFFSDSGSSAVEVALKMAFQSAKQRGEPRRKRFVHFTGSYHGDTLGAVSVGGIDLFHRTFGDLLFQALPAPAPTCYRCPLGKTFPDCGTACLEPFEDLLAQRGDEIAAVIVEPGIQGAAGMIPQPPGWLPRVAAAVHAAGALLVCDEVATGFGRTGNLFAVEEEGVRPDILCVAKGLSGGYLPLAATLTTEAVYASFLGEPEEQRTFFHGHTFTGNALACAAAVASLEKFEWLLNPVETFDLGQRMKSWVDACIAPHPHVGDVRHMGTMMGIELVADRASRAPFPASERAGHKVCRRAMELGLRVRPLGDVLVLMPQIGIEPVLVARMIEILRDALYSVYPVPEEG